MIRHRDQFHQPSSTQVAGIVVVLVCWVLLAVLIAVVFVRAGIFSPS